MSDNNTASISLEDVTEELVIEYLCTHPEFFQSHEDLLENLHIPHACGNAISLVERQVQLLRQRNQKVQAELIHTIHVAKDNERIFELTKKLTTTLLKANHITDALSTLHSMLHHEFNVDFVRIGLTKLPESCKTIKSTIAYQDAAHSNVKELLKMNKTICKELPQELLLYFFAGKMKQVRSCAIIPIGRQGMFGFIALGSKDKIKFHREKDTLFLDYIGKILGHILDRLLS